MVYPTLRTRLVGMQGRARKKLLERLRESQAPRWVTRQMGCHPFPAEHGGPLETGFAGGPPSWPSARCPARSRVEAPDDGSELLSSRDGHSRPLRAAASR